MGPSFLSKRLKLFMCITATMITMAAISGVEAMTEKEIKLLELARHEFGSLTQTEEILLRLVAISTPMDCSKGRDRSLANYQAWGEERKIRAALITWICTTPQARSFVSNIGIAITGAYIEGILDLSFIKISFPMFFEYCAIPKGVYLFNSEIHDLSFRGSHTGAIIAANMRAQGNVILDNARIEGEVNLVGSFVHGTLKCNGTNIINAGGRTIDATHLMVGGDVLLNSQFISEGTIMLKSATIKGDFQCADG